jgi:hypothetical protein
MILHPCILTDKESDQMDTKQAVFMISSKVADLTIHEFEGLIKKIVMQTISEIFSDPDEGLEIREELKNRLRRSVSDVQSGGKTISAESLAAKFGVEW